MALLSFAAIDGKQAKWTMIDSFYGLKSHYDYLTNSKRRLERPESQPQARWKQDTIANKHLAKTDGCWVILLGLKENSELSETQMQAFTAEDVGKVAWVSDPKNTSHQRPIYNEIEVLENDPDGGRLRLAELPIGKIITIRPNTYQLQMQLNALKVLQNRPTVDHRGLIELLKRNANWPKFSLETEPEWLVLTDQERPGAEEQRTFVRKALSTPDFAFLDGPPGSGKTTVICELVLQMIRAGKRVLMCASTHVAVDNVLDRLMHETNVNRNLIVPVRIGKDHNLSDSAKEWTLERRARTELSRLKKYLSNVAVPSAGQTAFLETLQSVEGKEIVERLLLDGANLVCGSSIGILQHPDIKKSNRSTPMFDMLIVDEASKTTFQEFLVPAMLAKRWVLVGDPRQLSPYVDDASFAANLDSIITDGVMRNACVDVFRAKKGRCGATAVVTDEQSAAIYKEQALARKAFLRDIHDPKAALADIVIGAATDLNASPQNVRIDLETLRLGQAEIPTLQRRHLANGASEAPNWAGELAWRQVTRYSLRRAGNDNAERRLKDDCDALLPHNSPADIQEQIDLVRRIALPSILEALETGFERASRQRTGNALSDGFPKDVFADRHVLLKYQHRMHPDIASFPAQAFYEGEALHSPPSLADRTDWSFRTNEPRAIWRDVRGGFDSRRNHNLKEVTEVINELKQFIDWARSHPAPDGGVWEVAILAFYRGQEKAFRDAIQKLNTGPHRSRRIQLGPHCVVDVCTVDRFQGQEADLVFISFARNYATSFLQSPNRLNVALTRARHRRVIVGDRNGLAKARGALGDLAKLEKWDRQLKEYNND